MTDPNSTPPTGDAPAVLPDSTVETGAGPRPTLDATPAPVATPAPASPTYPIYDPACPHIATGVAWIAAHTKEGRKLEDALGRAADWVARNAPSLYTLAQATSILRGLVKH